MELFFNELSIENQFSALEDFREAFRVVMRLRNRASRYGRHLRCKSDLRLRKVFAATGFHAAFDNHDERSAFVQWLSREGTCWDSGRHHNYDEYMVESETVVTESSVGEAAYRCFSGESSAVVGLEKTSWARVPLKVVWTRSSGDAQTIPLLNFWELSPLTEALEKAASPIESWAGLEDTARRQFPSLVFAHGAFAALRGHPFHHGGSRSVLEKLSLLNRLKENLQDGRADEVNEIYSQHFSGTKQWFTNSSETEKSKFRSELTFRHPETGHDVLCSWHGKVKTPQIRIHFIYPITAENPLFVMYVGPKITKQ